MTTVKRSQCGPQDPSKVRPAALLPRQARQAAALKRFSWQTAPAVTSLHLLAERAALREPRLAARGLAQHRRAAAADDDGLRVAEDGRDVEAAGALDVHEKAVGRRDEALELVAAQLQLLPPP